MDVYARLGIFFPQQLKATAALHFFSFAHENNSGYKIIRKPAGAEVDIIMEYKPSAIVNLQAGYAMIFATENMERVKGGDKKS